LLWDQNTPEAKQLRQELIELSPIYGRRIAITHGISSVIGFAVGIYVYVHFPHPELVWHIDQTNSKVSESFDSYLFAIPSVLAILCIMTTFASLFPKKAQGFSDFVYRNNEDLIKLVMPNVPSYPRSAKTLLATVTIGSGLFDTLLLGATVYRSWMVAMGTL
jgi:hypothetical protein